VWIFLAMHICCGAESLQKNWTNMHKNFSAQS
jgi:hypothetical protein